VFETIKYDVAASGVADIVLARPEAVPHRSERRGRRDQQLAAATQAGEGGMVRHRWT